MGVHHFEAVVALNDYDGVFDVVNVWISFPCELFFRLVNEDESVPKLARIFNLF